MASSSTEISNARSESTSASEALRRARLADFSCWRTAPRLPQSLCIRDPVSALQIAGVGVVALKRRAWNVFMKYFKTESGQQAFNVRSKLISARQRAVFIMVDGVRSGADVVAATQGLGATQDDLDYLVRQGFLVAEPESSAAALPMSSKDVGAASVKASAEIGVIGVSAATPSVRTAQERYAAAMPIATKVTADLGFRGFMLNLAIEKASGFDDLLALLPKIQAAAGAAACIELERVLKGQ